MTSPPDYRTVCNRPRTRFDCSYLGTKSGVLKLAELICSAIAAGSYYYCAAFKYDFQTNSYSYNSHRKPTGELGNAMALGYYFYRIMSPFLGCSVNFLLWSYLFHIVERYHTIPWYIIEYILCFVFGILSIVAGSLSAHVVSLMSFSETAFVVAEVFSFAAALAFFFNIFVVYQRKSKNIPPQTSET